MESLPQENKQERLDQEWSKMEKLLEYLTSLGLRTHNITKDLLQSSDVQRGMTVPIVYDGIDGIRMRYNRREGIRLSFTNAFEDPEDEVRKKVRAYWDVLGDEASPEN